MAITVQELLADSRFRLSDTESDYIFSDEELTTHIDNAVVEFARFRPVSATTTIEYDPGQSEYSLPDTCITVNSVESSEGALLDTWENSGVGLVFTSTLEAQTLTVRFSSLHAKTSDSYTSIPYVYKGDILDLIEALCLEIIASDMAKRPAFTDTQVRVDHKSAAFDMHRRARAIRARLENRLSLAQGAIA